MFGSSGSAQAAGKLTGQIAPTAEGAMEGVVVSAKKAGSTITISVVSDAQGNFSFPTAKLEPGQYTLRVRAIGYDLDGPRTVERQPPTPRRSTSRSRRRATCRRR